jgi:hypothetical protein
MHLYSDTQQIECTISASDFRLETVVASLCLNATESSKNRLESIYTVSGRPIEFLNSHETNVSFQSKTRHPFFAGTGTLTPLSFSSNDGRLFSNVLIDTVSRTYDWSNGQTPTKVNFQFRLHPAAVLIPPISKVRDSRRGLLFGYNPWTKKWESEPIKIRAGSYKLSIGPQRIFSQVEGVDTILEMPVISVTVSGRSLDIEKHLAALQLIVQDILPFITILEEYPVGSPSLSIFASRKGKPSKDISIFTRTKDFVIPRWEQQLYDKTRLRGHLVRMFEAFSKLGEPAKEVVRNLGNSMYQAYRADMPWYLTLAVWCAVLELMSDLEKIPKRSQRPDGKNYNVSASARLIRLLNKYNYDPRPLWAQVASEDSDRQDNFIDAFVLRNQLVHEGMNFEQFDLQSALLEVTKLKRVARHVFIHSLYRRAAV